MRYFYFCGSFLVFSNRIFYYAWRVTIVCHLWLMAWSLKLEFKNFNSSFKKSLKLKACIWILNLSIHILHTTLLPNYVILLVYLKNWKIYLVHMWQNLIQCESAMYLHPPSHFLHFKRRVLLQRDIICQHESTNRHI